MDNENLDGLQGSSSHSRFAFQDPTDYHTLSTMHSHHHHNHRHLHSSSTSSRYSGSAAAAVRAISGKPALAHTIHDVGKSSVATSDTRSKITTDTVSSTSSGSGNMGGLLEIADDERRERAEWQEMLTAALTGEVVDSEKKRLNTQPDDLMMNMSDTEFAASLSELLQNQDYRTLFKHIHTELWVGCRAAIRGRTTVQEKQTLESLRVKHVDNVLRSVMEFNTERCVGSIEGFGATEQGEAEFNKECLVQLQKLLRKVDYIEGLYPTLKALGDAKPLYVSAEFQARLSAMISWTNLVLRLQLLVTMLQRWTGSRELELYSTSNPNTYVSTTAGITKDVLLMSEESISNRGNQVKALARGTEKEFQHTPFVERLLKENGLQKIFEQKMMIELELAIFSARQELIKNSGMYKELGLSVAHNYLKMLLRFPPRLLQTCLKIRLQSADNLSNPTSAQVDQLMTDFRDSLSVACRVKRSFLELTMTMNQWSTDAKLDPEYDIALRSCLQTYFRLLKRKLVVNTRDGNNKDFELLESQWGFFQEIVRDIDGGQYEMALRYCQLARFLVRSWMSMVARMLNGPQTYDQMASRELGKWLCRTLQIVRPPVLKSQRLLRTIQNAVANSTDYAFDDPFPLLAQLVDTKHVLVYTAGEWESGGVFVIGSQSILQKPHLAKKLLTSCIMDESLTTDQYRDCYLLVVRTDADFNWTGTSVAPEEPIAYQDLHLSPGQMRLISPGVARLDRHRQWLERIGIAAKRPTWDMATAVTDEIIDAYKTKSEGTAYGDDGDDELLGSEVDAPSDPEGMRPSLTAFDGWLDRINNRNAAEPREVKAPARIRELTRAHNPRIQREWTLLKYGIVRLLDALTQMPDMLRTLHIDFHERRYYERRGPAYARDRSSPALLESTPIHHDDGPPAMSCRGANCDLLETVQDAFTFVSNTASRGSRFLDLKAERYMRLALLHMCVGWCGFITEDCIANEKSTFRWAVLALEFTMRMSKHNTVQVLPGDDWQLIKSHVAGCLTLMISHFDILGARDEETKKSRQQQQIRERDGRSMDDPAALMSLDGIEANYRTQQMQKMREQHSHQVDLHRDNYLADDGRIGRVIEVTARPEDQTLRLLAASSSNITIRWQIGQYIGGGAFGSVYVGINLDTSELMAVKEIRFPARPIERSAASGEHPGSKIVREMKVMSMLQHPNIVTYYGIEVHREKVYLFMELCTKGSLTKLIHEQGRIDEETTKLYVVQMLRGLRYLHSSGVCHRDIKCDNTLLDESMTIKLVDFGAAKVLNQQSLAATHRTRKGRDGATLTGTPMYMAPEVITGSNGGIGGAPGAAAPGSTAEKIEPGALGAQDIWSLGCCIVEMLTGQPPWAHLDNEWAIMYHVVADNPPLPEESLVSSSGMDFIKQCFTRQPAARPGADALLKHEWVTSTLRRLEHLEARGQPPSKLSSDYVAMDIVDAGLMSASVEGGPRSALASFLDSMADPSAADMDGHSVSSVGSVRRPPHSPNVHALMHDKAFGSPLGRTPGSTHSASTNAWPYNKTFADFRQFSATGGKPADLTEPVDGTLNVYHALSTASVADGQAVDGSPSADSTSSQVAAAAAQYAVPSAQTYLSADAQKSMSSDEKKDVFDITRKAVSALLSLPLEGSDVSGVAGWLGQDNTPLALLDADEVKETVAATSQIVVRQREQQIRRQQELREGGVLAKRVKSQMGIVSELASSEVELSYSAPGFVPLKSEPPALYPLPPGDDDEEEDEEEEDEEEEDEEEEEEDDGTSNL